MKTPKKQDNPLQIPATANPMPQQQLKSLAQVKQDDVKAAIEQWNKQHPDYKNLLEAEPEN